MASQKSPEPIEVDQVLVPGRPPSRNEKRTRPLLTRPVEESKSRLIATILDEFIRIPGTKIRIGLDPIIGLFPGIGDVITSMVGSHLLAEAQRHNVPRWVQWRMVTNLMLNAMAGSIPIFGDLFSFWYKSNSRNYALLKKHATTEKLSGNRQPPPPPSRWLVTLTVGCACSITIIAIYGLIMLLKRFF